MRHCVSIFGRKDVGSPPVSDMTAPFLMIEAESQCGGQTQIRNQSALTRAAVHKKFQKFIGSR